MAIRLDFNQLAQYFLSGSPKLVSCPQPRKIAYENHRVVAVSLDCIIWVLVRVFLTILKNSLQVLNSFIF